MLQRADAQVIQARVPLAEMFGYATALRSLTQGRAVYTMQFCALRTRAGERRGSRSSAAARGKLALVRHRIEEEAGHGEGRSSSARSRT